MTDPLPAASPLPAPPPVPSLPFINAQNLCLTPVAISYLTQFWAALSGQGGAIDQIGTINNMDGDATFDQATGHITVFSSQGRLFVASAFSDTTDAANIISGILDAARIAAASLTFDKLQDETAFTLLGNPNGIAGPVLEIALGTSMSFIGNELSAAADAFTVATLPAANANQWRRTFVTDSNSTTFGAIVAGGGANPVPAYSDGTHWRIG